MITDILSELLGEIMDAVVDFAVWLVSRPKNRRRK